MGQPGSLLAVVREPQGWQYFVNPQDAAIQLFLLAELDLGLACTNLSYPIQYEIGQLAPGTDELTLSRVDRDVTFLADVAEQTLIESIEFTVGLAPLTVNSLRWQGPLALSLLIGLIGFASVRRMAG